MPDQFSFKQEILRKLIHTLSIVLALGVIFMNRNIMLSVIVSLGIILPILDIARQKIRFFTKIFHFFFREVVRPEEHARLTGASYLFIGSAIVTVLFSPVAAATGILFLGIGDSCAAIFGRKFGETKIGSKSLEGSLAFILSCIVIVPFIPKLIVGIGIIAAIFAAVVEMIPMKKIDDNLVIPIITAIIIQFLGGSI